MQNLDPNYIWIPNGEKYGGYTDRHAILSKNNFYDYLNLLEPILLQPDKLYEKMKSRGDWNLERYIKFHLDRKGYSSKVKFFPYIMYSVRDEKIKTTFRPGTYSHKHKYFIKYFKEYLSTIIFYYLIKQENINYNNFFMLNIFYKLIKNLIKIRFVLKIFLKNSKIKKKFDENFVKENLENKIIL